MSELSDESRALIEAEGPLDEATPLEIEAMRVRVVAVLGGLPAPGTATSPAPDPSPVVGKAAAGASLKVVGTAIAAAVGSSALLFALNQPAPDSPLPSRTSAAVTSSLPSPAPLTAPVESVEPPAAVPNVSAPPTSAATPLARPLKSSAPAASSSVPPVRSASEEALLVATAEAQLRGGHPAAALALYEQHLRDYPKGALRHESQSGRIVALCGVGRSAEARAEIARFAERHPGSQTLLRMQRACGIESP